jgi:hypothetical protein
MESRDKSATDSGKDEWDIDEFDTVEFVDIDVDKIDPNDVLTYKDDIRWERSSKMFL